MTPRAAAAGCWLLLLVAGLVPARAAEPSPSADDWRAIAGSWSVNGRRHELAVEGGGRAATVEAAGTVALAEDGGLGTTFRAELVGYDDGTGGSRGRAVWTDGGGDRIFLALTGEPLAAGRRIAATITGGSGRFAGLEGELELTWRYVVSDEEGRIEGRATDLRGRVRLARATR